MFSRWYREHWTSVALTAVALILAVALGIQWLYLDGERQGALAKAPAAKAPPPPPPTEEVESGVQFQLPGLDDYAQMSQRPLFMEGRRPGADEPEQAAAPVATTPLNMKLMGVVFGPKGRLALLVDSKGKYKRLREKEAHEGWTVVALAPDRISLQQGEEKKDLPLLKVRPKPPPQPGVPGAPPPGSPQHQPVRGGMPPQQQMMPEDQDLEQQPEISDEQDVDTVDFEEPDPGAEMPEQ